MEKALRILIIEDSEDDTQLLLRELQRGGYEVEFERVETAEAMQMALGLKAWDLIISDYTLPTFNAPNALAVLKASGLDLPFIIISGTIGEETAVTALKAGANDFLIKGNFARLGPAIERELREAESRRERRRAEAALKSSETRYRLAASATNDVIWEWDSNTNELIWSENAQSVFGYMPEEVNAEAAWWDEHIHPEDRERVVTDIYALLESGGTIWTDEYRFLRRDGSIAYIVDRAYVERDADGKPLRMIGAMSDITERRQAEEALWQSEENYGAIVENTIVGVYRTNLKGDILYANEALVRILEFDTRDEMMAQGIIARYADLKDREILLNMLREEGRVSAMDVNILTRKGKVKSVLLSATLEGEILTTMISDVTERKRAEEALRESEKRYRSLFENMLEGYAYCQILLDHDQPQDFIYIDVNNAFEVLTGLKNVAGKKVSEVIPGIQESNPELFEIYGRVALTGKPESFETYLESLGIWFSIAVYSPRREYFVAVFDNITERKQAEEALAASESRYRTLFESNPHPMWVYDLETLRFLAVNDTALEHYGYSQEEFLSMTIKEIRPAEDVPALMTNLKEAQQNLHTPTAWRHQKKDGSLIDVEITSHSVHWEERPARLVLANDITKRKEAEEALLQSEEQYRSLFEDSPVSLWVEDFSEVKQRLDELKQKGIMDIPAYFRENPEFVIELAGRVRILDVNNAAMKLYHAREKSELLGSLPDVLHAMPLEQFESELIQVANGRLNFEREELDHTLTGQEIHVNVRWSVAPGYEDSLAKVIVSTIDVTERKQSEETLRLQSSALNSAANAIVITNPEGTIEWINPAVTAITGYTAAEAIGKNPRELFKSGVHNAAVYKDLWDTILAGNVWHGEFINRSKDGRYYNEEQTITPLMDPNGKITHFIAIKQDITERKQAEEALREKERLLSEAQRIGHIGSWSYDILADTFIYSDQMYRLFDATKEELRHTREGFLDLIYSPDRPMAAKWLEDIRLRGQVKEIEFLIFRKNSELRYLRCAGAVSFDKTGKPARFIGTAQDVTERKLAEIQIRQQIERLTALRKIDQAISSSFDLNVTLDVLLSQVISQLQVDAADILLVEPDRQTLAYAAGKGFRTSAIESAHLRMADSQAGRAAQERRPIHVESLENKPDERLLTRLGAGEGFVCYFGVPLIVKGKVKGVLEIFHRSSLQPYPEWLDFLNTLAGQAAIAVEDAQLFENLERSNRELSQAYDATIEGWSRALDLRDKETEGHTQRVTEMTLRLAHAFGLPEEELLHIRRGALLHDIGKMGVPDHILLKPGELTDDEWVRMKSHPQYAYDLLRPITFLAPALDIPYCHHEKWDGTGYPRGLKGQEIPLVARLFAVVDVWDALRSDRPYRPAWTVEKAREYIREQAGIYFDPRVVDYFLGMLKDE